MKFLLFLPVIVFFVVDIGFSQESSYEKRLRKLTAIEAAKTLYKDLSSFKDDARFHEFGFSDSGTKYRVWYEAAESLNKEAHLELIKKTGISYGDLIILGRSWMRSKGGATDYITTTQNRIRTGFQASPTTSNAPTLGGDSAKDKLIGSWIFPGQLKLKIDLVRNADGTFSMGKSFNDEASETQKVVIEKNGDGYTIYPPEYNKDPIREHWKLNSNGNLESHDSSGLIGTAEKSGAAGPATRGEKDTTSK